MLNIGGWGFWATNGSTVMVRRLFPKCRHKCSRNINRTQDLLVYNNIIYNSNHDIGLQFKSQNKHRKCEFHSLKIFFRNKLQTKSTAEGNKFNASLSRLVINRMFFFPWFWISSFLILSCAFAKLYGRATPLNTISPRQLNFLKEKRKKPPARSIDIQFTRSYNGHTERNIIGHILIADRYSTSSELNWPKSCQLQNVENRNLQKARLLKWKFKIFLAWIFLRNSSKS